MPAKSISSEKRIAILNSVLEPEHHEAVAEALQEAKGDLTTAAATLKDKLPEETVQHEDRKD